MVDGITANALQGIQRAQSGMQRNALEIAKANQSFKADNTKDPARSLVELNQNKNVAQANMKVLKTADDLLGSLLDVLA
jgi:hypothetical protein